MVQYIGKAALVAEIENRLKANGAFDECGDEAWAEDKGMREAYKSILSFLDTLEVKEADLDVEKELKSYGITNIKNRDVCIAKHFFELGLNTKHQNLWHDSNKEQPECDSQVITYSPKSGNAEALNHCAKVFEGNKWCYLKDILSKDDITNL